MERPLRALPCLQDDQKCQLALCLGPCSPGASPAPCFPSVGRDPGLPRQMKLQVRTRRANTPYVGRGQACNAHKPSWESCSEKNVCPRNQVLTPLVSPSPHPHPGGGFVQSSLRTCCEIQDTLRQQQQVRWTRVAAPRVTNILNRRILEGKPQEGLSWRHFRQWLGQSAEKQRGSRCPCTRS